MKPILTIAIPTYNRAEFLAANLRQLEREMHCIDAGSVEILISDNASSDHTLEVVAAASTALCVRYIRNPENISSDLNFVSCFRQARGAYLLLLGDDDLLCDGTLDFVLKTIAEKQPGVLCLRAFGYDEDARREQPQIAEGSLEALNADAFLLAAGASITLISACIFRRTDFDAGEFAGSNLVQVHMVLRAAVCGLNFVTRRYRLACKRDNSGGYDFFRVFGVNLFGVLDAYVGRGLSRPAVTRYGQKLLLQFFPQYVFRILQAGGSLTQTRTTLEARFASDWVYKIVYVPVFKLPRALGLVWIFIFALMGRLFRGDGMRMLMFVADRFRNKRRGSRS